MKKKGESKLQTTKSWEEEIAQAIIMRGSPYTTVYLMTSHHCHHHSYPLHHHHSRPYQYHHSCPYQCHHSCLYRAITAVSSTTITDILSSTIAPIFANTIAAILASATTVALSSMGHTVCLITGAWATYTRTDQGFWSTSRKDWQAWKAGE